MNNEWDQFKDLMRQGMDEVKNGSIVDKIARLQDDLKRNTDSLRRSSISSRDGSSRDSKTVSPTPSDRESSSISYNIPVQIQTSQHPSSRPQTPTSSIRKVPPPQPSPTPIPMPPPQPQPTVVNVEQPQHINNTRMSSGNGASRVVPVTLIRNKSVDDFNEQVVNMLDEVERRVEQLREAAGLLEQEKEQILDLLNSVSVNSDLLRLGQGDRDDINANTNRLAARTKAVEVVVNTPRSSEQQKALTSVNNLIDGVEHKMQEDIANSKETALRYLNACSPDMPDGPIDQKFQAQVIECTADDQKKIRRKLAQLISKIERAERVCIPQY